MISLQSQHILTLLCKMFEISPSLDQFPNRSTPGSCIPCFDLFSDPNQFKDIPVQLGVCLSQPSIGRKDPSKAAARRREVTTGRRTRSGTLHEDKFHGQVGGRGDWRAPTYPHSPRFTKLRGGWGWLVECDKRGFAMRR
eukprot:768663-Hanusia_phi.AAC.4